MSFEFRAQRIDPVRLALIALGSNVGDSVSLVRQAMRRLQTLSGATLQESSLWESSPVDCPPGSLTFVNAAVIIVPASHETPESLLAKLQEIEQEFGRRPKTVINEPRPLDLDLIAFGSEVRSSPQLTLPHPRAHQRRFVLEPLNEIAPDLILPGQIEPIRQLLAELVNDEVVRKLP